MGENRFLVRRGLRQMRETQRQGLYSLAGVSDLKRELQKIRHYIYKVGMTVTGWNFICILQRTH